jgi:FtsP/CotA-like multicopper oxidase with cupredoxin domain
MQRLDENPVQVGSESEQGWCTHEGKYGMNSRRGRGWRSLDGMGPSQTAQPGTRKRHAPSRAGRRRFLQGSAALGVGLALPSCAKSVPVGDGSADRDLQTRRLRIAPGSAELRGSAHGRFPIWGYNGTVPGPELRVRQGEPVRVVVDNGLEQGTTIHWHGVRVPHAMDGVPYVTQEPIGPGERFVYEFTPPDAGTFWYHPHMHSEEQVGRGIYGALIVEEREPPAVDRDQVWLLDDWRFTTDGDELAGDFGNQHDRMHGGRVGNHVTINGRPPAPLRLQPGERVRLRLINAANARIFALGFGGHRPWVVARDGQPCVPVRLDADEPLLLASAMRVDLILDGDGEPGSPHVVRDTFYEGLEYDLTRIVYETDRPLRPVMDRDPPALPGNPLAEPDVARARRHVVTLDGGMMGDMRGLVVDGIASATVPDMGAQQGGLVWGMNGVAAARHDLEPALTLARGEAHVLRIDNRSVWHHPMHLHGHSFRVIARDGQPTEHREWQDTVLVNPRETVDIAFVADNPGDWMFHCHILEHLAGGMMSLVRVT